MGKNLFGLKEHSHITVLNTIRVNGKISGADIARQTGYQPSTISNIIKVLKSEELIIKVKDDAPKSIGKPPVLWTVNKEKGVIIGVECILNEFRLSIVDVGGNTLRNSRKNFQSLLKGDRLLAELKIYLSEIIKDLRKENKDVLGLGVALAGLVDNERGVFIHSYSLEISNENIQEELAEHFHIPVQIENDANAGALCGIWFEGNNNVQKNVIFASINDVTKYIGTGLVLNNKLYKGRNFAGEVMRRLPNFTDIVEEIRLKVDASNSFWKDAEKVTSLTFTKLVEIAQQNDRIALQIVQKYCENISLEVVSLIGFFDPDIIYLGGDVALFEFLLQNYILPSVANDLKRVFSDNYILPKISISKYGIFTVSTGATALIMRTIFDY